jgi:hypothetical protein
MFHSYDLFLGIPTYNLAIYNMDFKTHNQGIVLAISKVYIISFHAIEQWFFFNTN